MRGKPSVIGRLIVLRGHRRRLTPRSGHPSCGTDTRRVGGLVCVCLYTPQSGPKPQQCPQQGRLARPIRANDVHPFSRGCKQVYTAKHTNTAQRDSQRANIDHPRAEGLPQPSWRSAQAALESQALEGSGADDQCRHCRKPRSQKLCPVQAGRASWREVSRNLARPLTRSPGRLVLACNTSTKKGAPRKAVTTPIGSSAGASTVAGHQIGEHHERTPETAPTAAARHGCRSQTTNARCGER